MTADALRRTIQGIEEAGSADRPRLPLGIPGIDRALPGGGLRLGGIHEVVGDESATGFCAALLARAALAAGPPCGADPGSGTTQGARDPPRKGHRAGTLLWLARDDDLYPPGLVRYGIGPGQLLVVSGLRRADDMLWAMEEALRCRAVSGVVAEIGQIGLAAGRRLMLAAEGTGVLGLVLSRRDGERRRGGGRVQVAVSRWRVTGVPGGHGGSDGPETRWRVKLRRCRSGRPGKWIVGWGDKGWKALPPSDAASGPGMRRAG
ncbi:MAG: hypothetical protein F4X15_17765 [Gemmatimonadetes bacterium]|nr:hypothetical protein [Gemmatimonadota bacterium]